MTGDSIKATVFISCGQSKKTDEIEVAHQIAERFLGMGFEPYIAVEEQTLKGVKENIFGQLERSEYLVFVDFRREQILAEEGKSFRGSLFSHQELAVAAYLEKDIMAFQESGVKPDDGLMRFLQTNAIPFSDRHLLADVVESQVRKRGWKSDWRSELVIERERGQYVDAFPGDKQARYFHLRVRNLHPSKAAINCYVYLEKVRDIDSNSVLPVEPIEFKWQGYTEPNALIASGGARRFDAFWVFHDAPADARYNIFADFTGFLLNLRGHRHLELTFIVLSENFPLARGTFALHVGSALDEVRLELPS